MKRDVLKRAVKRYGIPELVCKAVSTPLGMYANYRGQEMFGNPDIAAVFSAYVTSLSETAAFNCVVIPRQIIRDRRKAIAEGKNYGIRGVMATGTDLASEFIGADIIDTLISRPFFVGIGQRSLGPVIGTITGQVTADISYYAWPITYREKVRPRLEGILTKIRGH